MPAPPSFSSFPPSFTSFPDFGGNSTQDKAKAASSTVPVQKRGPKEKDKKSARKKRERDRRDRHSSPGPSRERGGGSRDLQNDDQFFDDERKKAEEDSARRTRQQDVSQPVFFSDKKGDPLSVQYGGIASKDIPRYHLVGQGGRKILGLTRAWTAVHRSSRSVEVVTGGRQKFLGISDVASRRLLETTSRRWLVTSAEASHKYQETDGFIPLPSRRPRLVEQDYRSLDPDKNHDSESDSSSASAASDSNDDSDQDGTIFPSSHEKMRSLEEQLSSDPSSVSTWLSLLSLSLSQVPAASKNASKVRSEITLSILGRALPTLLEGSSSTRIRLLYLHAGEEVWTSEKSRQEWEKALSTGDINIFLAWLDWRIRNGSDGVDGVQEAAIRVLTSAASELEKLRVFWRFTCALRQAGFIERSVALFQAQTDLYSQLSLLCHAVTYRVSFLHQITFEEQMNNLEEYWELEAPRIGEPGSTGWAEWYVAGKPERTPTLAPSSTRSNSAAVAISLSDPYQRWAHEEMGIDEPLRRPLRSIDPDAELDPYATILFSDVRPFLFALTSNRSKNLFRLMWLSHLGLHVPGLEAMAGAGDDDRWAQLHLISKAYIGAIFPHSTDAQISMAESHAGVLVGGEKHYMDSFGPIKNWSYRCIGPLEASEFRNGKARWAMWAKEDIAGVDVEFVRNVFEQCRMGDDDVEWDLLTLAFEAAVDVKGALKKSRRFLACAPESLPHWAAHARLERLRGRLDEARKVYQTVLSSPASTRSRLSAGPVWWDWAEMEWLADDSDAATRVVLRAAEVEGLGLAVLRGKRALEATAREIPETLWKAGTVVQESIAVASIGMLYHHISTLRSPTRPAVLRERLEDAVELFPDNTILLGMFLEMQRGQGLWGHVRKLGDVGISGDMMDERGISRRTAEIWVGGWEKGRWLWEVERIRGSLTAAIERERTRGSPVLWRLLLELEIRAGNFERAKNVLLRAIGECPLVKDIYMQAFNRLRPAFSAHELKSLWETMLERGLRIRKGLEEAMEYLGDGEGSHIKDGDGRLGELELDEIEHNSRELARLKPY
ncbi:NRDE-2, necessary for RNA interference-domain-containing protein [Russula brevipes]|nr:NRDE-2, necessary for RNA interference-domain-containing protein [Russula brevipes]